MGRKSGFKTGRTTLRWRPVARNEKKRPTGYPFGRNTHPRLDAGAVEGAYMKLSENMLSAQVNMSW